MKGKFTVPIPALSRVCSVWEGIGCDVIGQSMLRQAQSEAEGFLQWIDVTRSFEGSGHRWGPER
eukprot:903995-Rhodomonas_salina.2